MKRAVVLGVLLAFGALAAVKAQPPAANAPKVVEVEKVKDNLWVLRGGGGNTAVFATAKASPSSTRRTRAGASRSSTR